MSGESVAAKFVHVGFGGGGVRIIFGLRRRDLDVEIRVAYHVPIFGFEDPRMSYFTTKHDGAIVPITDVDARETARSVIENDNLLATERHAAVWRALERAAAAFEEEHR